MTASREIPCAANSLANDHEEPRRRPHSSNPTRPPRTVATYVDRSASDSARMMSWGSTRKKFDSRDAAPPVSKPHAIANQLTSRKCTTNRSRTRTPGSRNLFVANMNQLSALARGRYRSQPRGHVWKRIAGVKRSNDQFNQARNTYRTNPMTRSPKYSPQTVSIGHRRVAYSIRNRRQRDRSVVGIMSLAVVSLTPTQRDRMNRDGRTSRESQPTGSNVSCSNTSISRKLANADAIFVLPRNNTKTYRRMKMYQRSRL